MKSITLTLLACAGVAYGQTYNTPWSGAGASSHDTASIDGQVLTVEWLEGTGYWESYGSLDLSASGFTTLSGSVHTFTESEAASTQDAFHTYEFTLPTGYTFTNDLHIIISSPNAAVGTPIASFLDFTNLTLLEQREGGFGTGPVNLPTSSFSSVGADVYLDLGVGEEEATAIFSTADAAGLNSFRMRVTAPNTYEEDGIALYGSVVDVVAIPEPSTMGMFSLGCLALLLRRRNLRVIPTS